MIKPRGLITSPLREVVREAFERSLFPFIKVGGFIHVTIVLGQIFKLLVRRESDREVSTPCISSRNLVQQISEKCSGLP